MTMPRISEEDARRRMAEVLREQAEKPTLRPRDDAQELHNPFRQGTAAPRPILRPSERKQAAEFEIDLCA
jgi:hypothetical protein